MKVSNHHVGPYTANLSDVEIPKSPTVIRIKVGDRITTSYRQNRSSEASSLDVLAEVASQREPNQIRQLNDSIMADLSATQIERAVNQVLNLSTEGSLKERTWLQLSNLTPRLAKVVAIALHSSESKITALILEHLEAQASKELACVLINPQCKITVLVLKNLLLDSAKEAASAMLFSECNVGCLVLENLSLESVLVICNVLERSECRVTNLELINLSNSAVTAVLFRYWDLQTRGMRKMKIDAHPVSAKVSALIRQFNRLASNHFQDDAIILDPE